MTFAKNIFKDIEVSIFNDNGDYLSLTEGHKRTILNFLNNPVPETASDVFRFIQDRHEKEVVFTLLNNLKLYEKGFKEMLPDHRDHYLHSASVYVLGLAIYNSYPRIRSSLQIGAHDHTDEELRKSFLFRWALSACLHDIAYPLEIALRSFNKYSNTLHRLEDSDKGSFLKIDPSIYDDLNLLPILNPRAYIGMQKRDTGLGLIADHLTRGTADWESPLTYETLLDFLSSHLEKNLKSGRIDHGVFSALILLNRTHRLYQQQIWDDKDFYFDIVDAATAIFLHNSYIYSKLKDIFGEGSFLFDHPSSLGFLLFLCDSFCEWSRGRTSDANLFGFYVTDRNIVFKVPSETKDKFDGVISKIDRRVKINIITEW